MGTCQRMGREKTRAQCLGTVPGQDGKGTFETRHMRHVIPHALGQNCILPRRSPCRNGPERRQGRFGGKLPDIGNNARIHAQSSSSSSKATGGASGAKTSGKAISAFFTSIFRSAS